MQTFSSAPCHPLSPPLVSAPATADSTVQAPTQLTTWTLQASIEGLFALGPSQKQGNLLACLYSQWNQY